MNTTIHSTNLTSVNYKLIIPISMCCALISVIISSGILLLVYSTRRLHTTTHTLVCNTCLTSIFYSLVQNINYIYLIFISWDTSDLSCRFRAYFSYMSIASVIYSYLLQALSRLFFSKYHTQHRWVLSFRTHYQMIFIQWLFVMSIPLSTLISKDVYYRPTFLCWVPVAKLLHVVYTITACYLIPTVLIIVVYCSIYYHVRYIERNSVHQFRKIQQKRNLEMLRNILILISIYTCGGLSTLLYVITRIEIFYSMGIISLPVSVTIEKLVILILDREIRKHMKLYFDQMKKK
ncbi:unnamed protein product [Adineta ricciae]|uniref:G-protein coupled receptors family 1 profile domain-containing protein n=1 Tax=Adineta ricciae TaxID=249248 RepID=A0A815R9W2_ADIRI|nr:unnamed protein product [Adineta ricciae]CAF1474041.1 unnamed protein product [Adineta ricciae]